MICLREEFDEVLISCNVG